MSNPAYCEQCGNPLQEEDRFCGTCGAAILSPPTQAEQVIPRQEAASHAPSGRRRVPWVLAVSVLAVLVVGTGALAAVAFQDRLGFLGGSDPQPTAEQKTTEPETSPEETSAGSEPSPASVSPDSPPNSAFDPLMAELRSRTDVPIMLPAELPEKLQNVAVDESASGGGYGVGFFVEPQDDVVESWSRTVGYGTMRTTPVDEAVSNEYFEAESVEEVELPDGTIANLRLLSPVDDQSGTQGEFWEGKFQRDDNEYTLVFLNPDRLTKDEVVQVLSSMVSVPNSIESTSVSESEEDTTEEQVSDEEQGIQDFVFEYYAAVEQQDWEATYSLLADDSQAEFAEKEWIESQETREATDGGFSSLESAEVETIDGVGAIVDLSFSDGTTGETTLNYSPTSQEWKRYLTDEDISYLEDLIGDETSTLDQDLDEETAVEETIRNHYEAIGNNDFEEAYSYFGSTFRSSNSEEDWVAQEEDQGITSSTVNSIDVGDVSEDTVQAAVDVTFDDSSGSSNFYLGWELVKESGQWKLDLITVGGETD